METTTLVSPMGRMVQGHPLRPITKDMQGNPLRPFRDGTPRQNFFLAVAVKKSNKKIDFFMETIENVARNAFPRIKNLSCPSYNFSWKIKDGDIPNSEGEIKEGFEGCWIIRFSNCFCSEVVDLQTRQPIINQEGIKCGDYVQVVASIKGNGNKEKPGLYLNQLSVGKVMDGEPIINKRSYIDMFDLPENK